MAPDLLFRKSRRHFMDIELEDFNGDEAISQIQQASQAQKTDVISLQMVLVTSSMNHEYARRALQKAKSYEKKQDLLLRMDQLKNLYYSARHQLSLRNPEKLDSLERELNLQKQQVFAEGEKH